MLLKDNKKGAVTLIMKRMKGSSQDMSPSFASETAEPKKMVDGAEQDHEAGYDACCNDMISAFKEGDSRRLKSSLKSFISMVLDEEQSEDQEY